MTIIISMFLNICLKYLWPCASIRTSVHAFFHRCPTVMKLETMWNTTKCDFKLSTHCFAKISAYWFKITFCKHLIHKEIFYSSILSKKSWIVVISIIDKLNWIENTNKSWFPTQNSGIKTVVWGLNSKLKEVTFKLIVYIVILAKHLKVKNHILLCSILFGQ